MIEQTSSNTSLTFEQMAQIEETKKRLSNLENEIIIANKNLSVINKDVVKATKEREYQEDLKSGLIIDIEKLRKEKLILENSNLEINSYLEKTTKEIKEALKDIEDNKASLSLRESAILSSENKIKKDSVNIDEKAQQILEERKVLETAYNAFNEALKTIVWK